MKSVKRMLCALLSLSFVLSAISCLANPEKTNGDSDKDTTTMKTSTTTQKNDPDPNPDQKTYNILFIGNSFTARNDLPDVLFANMARSAGYKVNVTNIEKGSWTLTAFASSSDVYGAKVDQALNSAIKYDYVVLQEQSTRSIDEDAFFYAGVRSICEKIKKNNPDAEIVLYDTWGFHDTHSYLTSRGYDCEEMTYRLAAAYEAIAREMDLTVAYTGFTVLELYRKTSVFPYDPADNKHPSYAGSFGAAATIFYTIFGDCAEEQMTYCGAVGANRDTIVSIAYDVAHNLDIHWTPALREEYKTTSEGKTVGGGTFEFLNGKGTEEEPYLVNKVSDLVKLGELVNGGTSTAGMYFKMENDIDLDLDKEGLSWVPIGTAAAPFMGNFDGNGYKVYNMNCSTATLADIGFFGCVSGSPVQGMNASVRNLTVYGKITAASNHAGGIVGMAVNTAKSGGAGGTTGLQIIENCVSYVSLEFTSNAGIGSGGVLGIAGNGTVVRDCTYEGTITQIGSNGFFLCGGIAGNSYGAELVRCINNGDITLTNTESSSTYIYVGGIVGQGSYQADAAAPTNLSYCINNGAIIASTKTSLYLGGLVGHAARRANSEIAYCAFYGSISGTSITKAPAIGDFYGYAEKTVTMSHCVTATAGEEADRTEIQNAFVKG